MSKETPRDRAARVLHYHADGDGAECVACLGNAKAALTAAIEDREGLAEVIDRHSGEAWLVAGGGQITDCITCGEVPTDVASHQAEYAARWLAGGGT